MKYEFSDPCRELVLEGFISEFPNGIITDVVKLSLDDLESIIKYLTSKVLLEILKTISQFYDIPLRDIKFNKIVEVL